MSNVTFAKSVDAFVAVEKKGAGAFGTLVEFAYNVVRELPSATAADVLKSTIKSEENAYRVAHPKLDAMPTSYRSAKSVVLAAVKAGVSLIREDGTFKGKTELEKECKEGKSDKTPVEKFTIAMNTATNVFADCATLEEMLACKAALEVLASVVVAAIKEAKAD